MECSGKFRDFISNIVLSDTAKQTLRVAYKTLKSRLHEDALISGSIVTSFLQGSFIRQTGVKPVNKDDKPDVDLIVVTNFDPAKVTPAQALNRFIPFLDKYYKDKWRMQGRSIGIELSNCCIDLVPTALPSSGMARILAEAFSLANEEKRDIFKVKASYEAIINAANKDDTWKTEPLLIPDREQKVWQKTHPLAQIAWTENKNGLTDGHYKRVVKALKWWKKNFVTGADSIKSYPLEHFIGNNCPNLGSISLAEYIVRTLSSMSQFTSKPYQADRGVPEHDVFKRVTESDFAKFAAATKQAHLKAKSAFDEPAQYESSVKWQELFGSEFPLYEKPAPTFTKRDEPSSPTNPNRYA